MFEAALDGSFKGMYIQGEDFVQSDPNTHHVTTAMEAMECVIVQDLFLNETAKFAHVFLPGSSFLEKDGTFTNAERRISPRAQGHGAAAPATRTGKSPMLLSNALGYPMNYTHPSEIMDEIARLTPTFTGVTYEKIDRLGSIQWPCNEAAPEGTPTMHVDQFVRGKGKFFVTEYVPTDERTTQPLPADSDDRPHPHASTTSARRRAAPQNISLACRGRLEIHPHDAEVRGINDGDWVGSDEPRGRDRAARAGSPSGSRPGVVYTTFHFPRPGANVVTTENSDWATNCPEYKVTAVEVVHVNQRDAWRQRAGRRARSAPVAA